MKNEGSNFRGKVVSSAQRQRKTRMSYLNLPKGVKQFSLEEGAKMVKLDFVPYVVTDQNHPERDEARNVATKGSIWYRRPFKIHRNIGAADEAVICLKSIGKKCPICEYQEKRYKEGASKEETGALRAKLRSLYVVIPIDSKKFDEVPHIWDMSDALFQNLLIEELELNNEFEDFFTLDNGYTAEIRFKWETLSGSTFPEARTIHFEKRDEYDPSVMNFVPALDNMLKIYSYEELHNKFFELENEETADEADIPEEHAETSFRRKKILNVPTTEEGSSTEQRKFVEDLHSGRGSIQGEANNNPTASAPIRRKKQITEPEAIPSKELKTCPHGHKFGVDTDAFNECDNCTLWDDCIEQKRRK